MNLRSMLVDNWGIKLVSLALSLTLWFYVTSRGKTEITLTIPLELRNIPQNTTVVGDVPGYLDVRVQGQERVLRDVSAGKKLAGVIDLTMAKIGENIIHVSPEDIRHPAGVNVTHLSLSEVRIRIETLMRKSVRLRPFLHGSPEIGYAVKGVTVVPQKIAVEGPASVLTALDKLQTIPIDIQGARENLRVDPKIDYQGQPVKLLEKNIEVQISIEQVKK